MTPKTMADIQRISPAEAEAKLAEGYTFIDVRTEVEFHEGHPAGAFNVPGPAGQQPNPDFLRVMNANFPKDTPIITGCRSGGRSLRAAKALVEDGYTNVLDQRAGWDGVRDQFGQLQEPGWTRVGLPSEKGTPTGRSYADLRIKG
jgi:rhodanese-related sulfurtransferase